MQAPKATANEPYFEELCQQFKATAEQTVENGFACGHRSETTDNGCLVLIQLGVFPA